MLERDSYERMAKGISEGLTQDKAYVGAGYSPNSAAVGATNLLKRHPEIKVRAQELREEKSEMFARANILPVAKVANELGINKRLILSELLDNAMISKAAVPVVYIKDKYRKLGLDMDITDAKLIENK